MIYLNLTRTLVEKMDRFSTGENIPLLSNIVFLLLFLILYFIQEKNDIQFININNSDFQIIDVFVFVIAIFSMYGIYIGFLQYITGHSEKARYLGKSKIKYLTDISIWYQITQTKSFLVTLFLSITLPVLFINTHGILQNNLLYTWQTSMGILLWIYIYLIGMSLKIMRILFLIKDDVDSGLEYNIRESIKRKYTDLFREMYYSGFDYNDIKNFFSWIKYDIRKVDGAEVGYFLTIVFSSIYENIVYFDEFKSIRRVSEHGNIISLFNGYKKFINEKWNYLSKFQEKVDFSTYKKLIYQDIEMLDFLISRNPELVQESDNHFVLNWRTQNIHNFLFDKLLEKATPDNMTDICLTVKQTTCNLKSSPADSITYYIKVEKYKWEQIFDIYLKGENYFALPTFSDKRVTNFQNGEEFEKVTFDNDNIELYSQICLNYLINSYGYIRELITENINLEKLILTMDKESQVAYILYQLLYPGVDKWNSNVIFYKEKLESAFKFLENDQREQLFLSAAVKVSNTHIGHRVTYGVLKEIFYNREKKITAINYFDQFEYSRISNLKLIFVQSILSNNASYCGRILIHTKDIDFETRVVDSLCVSYLSAVDELPSLIECVRFKDIMEDLIQKSTLDIRIIAHNLGLKGLLYYEWLLDYQVDSVDTVSTFLGAIKSRFKKISRYHFIPNSIFEFFIVKSIDVSYTEIFNNQEFLIAFKTEGNNFLRSIDMTANEFVESIYNKLFDFELVSIGKSDVEQISNKLTEILSN
ncbi:hypothetical protein [Oceanobacillus sp. 1P07AA]|uniref:hypothetical protein n=1 Tax=Oceanobacillus sp. 1P07AA TaxID=3132293 RepID=UPI0039A59593